MIWIRSNKRRVIDRLREHFPKRGLELEPRRAPVGNGKRMGSVQVRGFGASAPV